MSFDRKIAIVSALLDGIAWRDCATPKELQELDVLEVIDLVPSFMRETA